MSLTVVIARRGSSSGASDLDPLIQDLVDGAYDGAPAKMYAGRFPYPLVNTLIGTWTLATPAAPIGNVISPTEITIDLVSQSAELVNAEESPANEHKYVVIDEDGGTPIFLSVGLDSDTFNPRVVVDDMQMFGGDSLELPTLHITAASALAAIEVTPSDLAPPTASAYTSATQLKDGGDADLPLVGVNLVPTYVATAGTGDGSISEALVVTDRDGIGETINNTAGDLTTVEHTHVAGPGGVTGDGADVLPVPINAILTRTVLASVENGSGATTTASVTVPEGAAMLVEQNAIAHTAPILADSSGVALDPQPFGFTEVGHVLGVAGGHLCVYLSPMLDAEFIGKVNLVTGSGSQMTGFVSKLVPDDPTIIAINAFGGYVESTTSLAIGTGTKVFTVAADRRFLAGMYVRAYSAADEADYMVGTVTTYSGTTLTTSITSTGGSGTDADWRIEVGNCASYHNESGSVTHPSITFPEAFDNTRNLGLGLWSGYGNQVGTPRTGWTEDAEYGGTGTSVLCLQTQTKQSGDTVTDVTYPAAPVLLWGIALELEGQPPERA